MKIPCFDIHIVKGSEIRKIGILERELKKLIFKIQIQDKRIKKLSLNNAGFINESLERANAKLIEENRLLRRINADKRKNSRISA